MIEATDLDQSREERSRKLRGFFARFVTQRGGAADPRIEQAFASVPREPFAGPPPWFISGPLSYFPAVAPYTPTPDDDPAFLYQDVLVSLDPRRGINIGEPGFHAFCLSAIGIRESETVVHIGAGSGYYSAILASLVGELGCVHAIEIDEGLAERARANLARTPTVLVHCRSGAEGSLPRADAIYVNAACTQPASEWLNALKPGGRLLFPLQAERCLGGMLLLQRPMAPSLAWPARFVTRAMFIACQGLQDPVAGRRIADAFARGNMWHDVRSFRLDPVPDDSCWLRGEGWWLSTSPS